MSPRALNNIPRAGLGHWPTPLERCDRLRRALGGHSACPELWVKREDCSGLALGGNKVRKLDFLLGTAIEDGVDIVLTFGAVQSNHCRQTAAACAVLGLECELFLAQMVDRHDKMYRTGGNVLVDERLGAVLHRCESPAAGISDMESRAAELRAAGRAVAVIPFGGSDGLGTLGYVSATEELVGQMRHEGIGLGIDRIVVATSTGGTQAGLMLGAKKNGLRTHVTGMCVYSDAPSTEARVAPLMAHAAEMLGIAAPDSALIDTRDHCLGPGYGHITPETTEAMELFARTEALLLDPVYSGKAAAGLIEMIRNGEIPASERVLFVHTGGTPAIFVAE